MKSAVCVLTNNQPGITGCIEFIEISKTKMKIIVNVKGLKPGYHGFHIHKTGDLRKGCKSLCSHFNPFNVSHGDIKDNKMNRHVGDLGNIYANKKGVVKMTLYDNLIKLKGKCNIVGRSVVIHDKTDDLGKGGNKESLKTGNAGKRIACGVIGWA